MWTIDDIAKAITCDALHRGNTHAFNKVILDSREVTNGDIFVCMRGASSNGHDYISGAISKGAKCIIISEESVITQNVPADITILKTADTATALNDMGHYKRTQTSAKVVAITGSFGKTSTKEWLAYILSHFGKTHANYKSYNAFPGLPLTLANIPDECDFVIAEIGMSSRNEIKPLSLIAEPDIAVITTVGCAHIADFGTIEAIADEKSDIFAGLRPQGIAIIPGDEATSNQVIKKAQLVKDITIHKFGDCPDTFASLQQAHIHPNSQEITARISTKTYTYGISILGTHWQKNSLAVMSVLHTLGIDLSEAQKLISGFKGYSGRGQQYELDLNKGGRIRIIDESYNGGPESVLAAINTLKHVALPGPHGRRIAVIGDMYELGNRTNEMHQLVATDLNDGTVDIVHTSGKLAHTVHTHVHESCRGIHSDDTDPLALGQRIAQDVKPGDVYLVKGSRGPDFIKDGRMARVVEAIKHLGTVVKE